MKEEQPKLEEIQPQSAEMPKPQAPVVIELEIAEVKNDIEGFKDRLKMSKMKRKQKEEEIVQKANPMDYAFPDILSKPGQFLPGIGGGDGKGEFEVK